ncbi:hypothetical protein HQ590_16395, partial [bacterium]|nr:hypothetical protein [bacterium]
MNAREQALELLDRWHRSRRFADELLDDALDRSPLSGPDRALTTELFYGCLRHRSVLERLVTDLAARPPRPALAWVVQLGLYQLFFLDRVPAHAAVHETVAVGKKHVSPGEVGFVNALLRQASARREELQRQIAGWRTTEPWVYHSQPRWLWDRWVARWGAEQADALCAWNNKPAPVYVRVNTLRMGTRSGEPRVATAEPRTPPHPSPQTTAGPASPPEGRGDRNATRVLQGKSRSLEDPPLPSGGEGWGEGE